MDNILGTVTLFASYWLTCSVQSLTPLISSILMTNLFNTWLCLLLIWTTLPSLAVGQSRAEKVRGDRSRFATNGLWFYNDLERAFEVAKQKNQPVLVVLRCVPCTECVKLDDDMIESDPELQQILKSFVRVRIVGVNGLDLSLFEFDTDQSFAVFMFGPDRTLYARYGTRSDQVEWENDVSVTGLRRALEGVLNLHKSYPNNRELLLGKQSTKPTFPTPEKFPMLSEKYTDKIDYEGRVVESCIHCHMIGDAQRVYARRQSGKIPDNLLYPFPHPKTLGLILDPAQCASVKQIVKGSYTESAGFQIGDQIETLNGQAILSIADIQWVLHQLPMSSGKVIAQVRRGDTDVRIGIELPDNWKVGENVSWRESIWGLRQIALGGMSLKPSTSEERSKVGVQPEDMAFTVQHVGEYPPHDRAMKAGIAKGDVIVEFDGRKDFKSEANMIVHSLNQVAPATDVTIKLRRGAELLSVNVKTSD